MLHEDPEPTEAEAPKGEFCCKEKEEEEGGHGHEHGRRLFRRLEEPEDLTCAHSEETHVIALSLEFEEGHEHDDNEVGSVKIKYTKEDEPGHPHELGNEPEPEHGGALSPLEVSSHDELAEDEELFTSDEEVVADALDDLRGIYHGSTLLALGHALHEATVECAKPDAERETTYRERNLPFLVKRLATRLSDLHPPMEAALQWQQERERQWQQQELLWQQEQPRPPAPEKRALSNEATAAPEQQQESNKRRRHSAPLQPFSSTPQPRYA